MTFESPAAREGSSSGQRRMRSARSPSRRRPGTAAAPGGRTRSRRPRPSGPAFSGSGRRVRPSSSSAIPSSPERIAFTPSAAAPGFGAETAAWSGDLCISPPGSPATACRHAFAVDPDQPRAKLVPQPAGVPHLPDRPEVEGPAGQAPRPRRLGRDGEGRDPVRIRQEHRPLRRRAPGLPIDLHHVEHQHRVGRIRLRPDAVVRQHRNRPSPRLRMPENSCSGCAGNGRDRPVPGSRMPWSVSTLPPGPANRPERSDAPAHPAGRGRRTGRAAWRGPSASPRSAAPHARRPPPRRRRSASCGTSWPLLPGSRGSRIAYPSRVAPPLAAA